MSAPVNALPVTFALQAHGNLPKFNVALAVDHHAIHYPLGQSLLFAAEAGAELAEQTKQVENVDASTTKQRNITAMSIWYKSLVKAARGPGTMWKPSIGWEITHVSIIGITGFATPLVTACRGNLPLSFVQKEVECLVKSPAGGIRLEAIYST